MELLYDAPNSQKYDMRSVSLIKFWDGTVSLGSYVFIFARIRTKTNKKNKNFKLTGIN